MEISNDTDSIEVPYYGNASLPPPWEDVENSIAAKLDNFKDKISSELTLTHVPLLRVHDSEIFSENVMMNICRWCCARSGLIKSKYLKIMDPSFRVISSIQSQFIDEANLRRKEITASLENLKSRIIEKVMIDQKLVNQSKKH